MEKININFASIYSVALFGIIILTHEALKSSFMQRKRLKKPKVSAEIYLGLIKIKHSITASIKIYLFFLRDTLIVIIIYVFLTAIIQFINSPAIELKLLFLLLTFAIIPRKIPIFLQFFLTLKSCELLKLTENPLQLQQYLLIFYGVIALNLIKDYLYCRKKNWNKQNWLVVLIPFLIFINGDLILLNSQTIEHGLIITLIMTLSAIIWAAGTAQFWIVKNSKFESCCLVFASFIMFVPNFFIYPIFNYLPHNLQNGAKYVVYFPILCMVILIYFRQQARKMVNIN